MSTSINSFIKPLVANFVDVNKIALKVLSKIKKVKISLCFLLTYVNKRCIIKT
nr:MAG TPA: hypothetical protein [Caudoviricetes sp.]